MNQRCACGQEIDPAESPTNTCPTCGAAIASSGEPAPLPQLNSGRLLPTPKNVIICAVSVIAAVCVCWAIFTMAIMPVVVQIRNASQLNKCKWNLLEMAAALRDYNGATRGFYPSLSEAPGCLMFKENSVYPEYIDSLSVFRCPAQTLPQAIRGKEPLNDESYFYLSHVILNDEQGATFAIAYCDHVHDGVAFERFIRVSSGKGSDGGDKLIPVGGSVARYFLKEIDLNNATAVDRIKASIPIIVEWPSHHPEPGGHVLYLDGHVEFLKYPGPFPMTKHFIETMRQLDQLSPEIETNQ